MVAAANDALFIGARSSARDRSVRASRRFRDLVMTRHLTARLARARARIDAMRCDARY
jgi:hypothetical protein